MQAQEEISVAEEYNDNSLSSFAHWVASLAYTYKGDFDSGIAHGETSLEKAPTPADKVWAQGFLGFALCRSGQAHRAIDHLRLVAPLYDASQFLAGQVIASAYLGEAYWRAGQLDLAELTLKKGLDLAGPAGMKFFAGCMSRLQGEVALDRNPRQAGQPFAGPLFESAISTLRDINSENELANAYAGYGRLLKQQGRTTEARDYFTSALAIFERLGTLVAPDKMRSELAALTEQSPKATE